MRPRVSAAPFLVPRRTHRSTMSEPRTDWLSSAPAAPTNPKAATPLFKHLARLMRREDLEAREAAEFFRSLLAPEANAAQIAAALAALTAKGETGPELAGMASVLRSAAIRVPVKKGTVDISGTGGSPVRTFGVSTAAAFVAAGAGLPVAKQVNRGVMTAGGSAELLTALGVRPAEDPAAAQAALGGTGIALLAAPKFHPELRRVGEIRRTLGIRTCLNVLGLLANPAGVSRHLIGVWHRSMVEPVARALALLKAEDAWVVHGEDGLDEITLSGRTCAAIVRKGQFRVHTISPGDRGIKPARIDHLRAATAKEGAEIVRDVLASRRRDEARSLVVINAAAALVIGGIANGAMHAARLAEQSIDSGQAQNKLDRLIQLTNRKQASV